MTPKHSGQCNMEVVRPSPFDSSLKPSGPGSILSSYNPTGAASGYGQSGKRDPNGPSSPQQTDVIRTLTPEDVQLKLYSLPISPINVGEEAEDFSDTESDGDYSPLGPRVPSTRSATAGQAAGPSFVFQQHIQSCDERKLVDCEEPPAITEAFVVVEEEAGAIAGAVAVETQAAVSSVVSEPLTYASAAPPLAEDDDDWVDVNSDVADEAWTVDV